MTGRDAVVVDELFGRTAARNLADAQAFDGKTALGHCGRDGIPDATRRVVILNGDDALRFPCTPQQRDGVDRLKRIQIDHTNAGTRLLELIVGCLLYTSP